MKRKTSDICDLRQSRISWDDEAGKMKQDDCTIISGESDAVATPTPSMHVLSK